MIYADMALKEMEDCLAKSSLIYSVEGLTESKVSVSVTCRDTIINSWFDVKTQQYGFDLVNGGKKSCNDIVSFKEFLLSYIDICTNFIPKTKKVADIFGDYIGVQSVYDTFFGSVTEGYTASYRVISNDNMAIFVSLRERFTAQLVEFKSDRSKYKIIRSRMYDQSEDGSLMMIKDLDWYMDMVYVGYGTSDEIDFIRSTETIVDITWKELGVSMSAEIMNSSPYEMYYMVSKINGYDVEFSIDERLLGVDIDNLSALGTFLKRYVDSHKDDFIHEESKVEEPSQDVAVDLTKPAGNWGSIKKDTDSVGDNQESESSEVEQEELSEHEKAVKTEIDDALNALKTGDFDEDNKEVETIEKVEKTETTEEIETVEEDVNDSDIEVVDSDVSTFERDEEDAFKQEVESEGDEESENEVSESDKFSEDSESSEDNESEVEPETCDTIDSSDISAVPEESNSEAEKEDKQISSGVESSSDIEEVGTLDS